MKPAARVAIIITRLDLGGAQEVALETARRLESRGMDAVLYCGEGGRLLETARQSLGSRLVVLKALKHPLSPAWDLVVTLQLAWMLWWRGVDVVHTHSSKAGMVGRAAAWLAGVPVVCHTVHGWSFHDFMSPLLRRFYSLLEKAAAMVTDQLVVVADSLASLGLAQGIGDEGRYTTIRAASDLDSWKKKPARKPLLKAMGLKGNPPVVGTLANAKAQKCPEDFVRVAAQVLKKVPSAHFAYIGDGSRRGAAQSLAANLGIAQRVHFLGWKDQPQDLAAAYDVFLLTSLWEGLPCVFAQAMSAGIPVVATQVGGAAEIVREGKTGYLCQPHDTEAMADRVAVLLKKPALRRRLSAAARKSVGPQYGFEFMADATAGLYRGLLEAK